MTRRHVVLAAICASVWFSASGKSFAQPPTEPGAVASAARSSADRPLEPDENPRPGAPRAANAPQLTFSYFYVPGAALHPRDSPTALNYSGAGCVSTLNGTDRIINTQMQIPDGSVIKFLRLFYIDTSTTDDVLGYITRYDAGTQTQDLISVSSTGSGGAGTVLSSEISHTVDNFGFGYVLIGWPDLNSTTTQVCGLRVAYYPPSQAQAGTTIQASDIVDLRNRANAARTANGLAAFSFADATLTPGVSVVKAIHVAQLRQAVNEAYTQAGKTPPTYSDPGPPVGTIVRAAHMQELHVALIGLGF